MNENTWQMLMSSLDAYDTVMFDPATETFFTHRSGDRMVHVYWTRDGIVRHAGGSRDVEPDGDKYAAIEVNVHTWRHNVLDLPIPDCDCLDCEAAKEAV